MTALHTMPSRHPNRKSAIPPGTTPAGVNKSCVSSEVASQTANDRAIEGTRDLMIAGELWRR